MVLWSCRGRSTSESDAHEAGRDVGSGICQLSTFSTSKRKRKRGTREQEEGTNVEIALKKISDSR